MSMNIPWWAWTSVAALIGLAELHAPGSYLIWIAIGAGLTAAIEVGWGLSLSAQIGAFAVLSAIAVPRVISSIGDLTTLKMLPR